jgi:hypothetical protein
VGPQEPFQVNADHRVLESPESLATETTVLHAEAANPTEGITKAQARVLTRRIAHTLRTRFGIGQHGSGKDIVVVMSTGQVSSNTWITIRRLTTYSVPPPDLILWHSRGWRCCFIRLVLVQTRGASQADQTRLS